MLTIVNYGVGNLASISNLLTHLGIQSEICSRPADILRATQLLLPGIGAFDAAMIKLRSSGLNGPLHRRVIEDRIPILGICLGMQIMCNASEEGNTTGLGWFNTNIRRFDRSAMAEPKAIPHMGWNEVRKIKSHPVLTELPEESRFYFAHSYHAVCDDSTNILLETDYGYRFASALARDNIVAVQFHPEKSHKFGMALMSNFCNWRPQCIGRA